METKVGHFLTDVAIGVLGLFVGIDNLLRWADDNSLTQGLVIGGICTVLAATWLVYVFVKRAKEN